MNKQRVKFALRVVFALLFIVAGILHFTHTDFYLLIMPPYLPFHRALVYLSGAFEIAGGVGLIIPRTKKAASYGLIALLLAVFPANIYMATDDVSINGNRFSPLLLWLRLPLQFILIALVWWCVRDD
ncbi:MAG: DoxX family protein [Pyrinomonadaceae bacterium MAG19_C2-C3]|nr:DoxX family protein [Pyrinomonadaceae bacterium MAG19_C2-C3]